MVVRRRRAINYWPGSWCEGSAHVYLTQQEWGMSAGLEQWRCWTQRWVHNCHSPHCRPTGHWKGLKEKCTAKITKDRVGKIRKHWYNQLHHPRIGIILAAWNVATTITDISALFSSIFPAVRRTEFNLAQLHVPFGALPATCSSRAIAKMTFCQQIYIHQHLPMKETIAWCIT